MKNVKVYYWIPALAVAAVALAACHKDPATVVPQRAVERWNLLIEGHPVKAYDYLSPGYRSTHTLDQYVAFYGSAKVKWQGVKIDRQQCNEEMCTVNLTLELTVPAAISRAQRDLKMQTPLVERWIASNGQWYFLPDAQIGITVPDAAASPPAAETIPVPPPPGNAPSFIPRPSQSPPQSPPPPAQSSPPAPVQPQAQPQSPPPPQSDGSGK